jgi:hypothetical protein
VNSKLLPPVPEEVEAFDPPDSLLTEDLMGGKGQGQQQGQGQGQQQQGQSSSVVVVNPTSSSANQQQQQQGQGGGGTFYGSVVGESGGRTSQHIHQHQSREFPQFAKPLVSKVKPSFRVPPSIMHISFEVTIFPSKNHSL